METLRGLGAGRGYPGQCVNYLTLFKLTISFPEDLRNLAKRTASVIFHETGFPTSLGESKIFHPTPRRPHSLSFFPIFFFFFRNYFPSALVRRRVFFRATATLAPAHRTGPPGVPSAEVNARIDAGKTVSTTKPPARGNVEHVSRLADGGSNAQSYDRKPQVGSRSRGAKPVVLSTGDEAILHRTAPSRSGRVNE